MAETLTFENTTETTSVDNLSEDEQDSLKVGEALEEQQESLLAGKYKDARELEKAYVELEKKLGGETKQKDTGEPEAKEEKTDEDKPPQTNILDDLWDQAVEEKFDQKTLDQISNMSPRDLANMHLQYRASTTPKDLTENDVKELKGMVGGDENYSNMLQWAQQNLNEQEVSMFDTVMDRGDPLSAFFAVRSLAYRYNDAVGYDGKEMLTGSTPKQSNDMFRSQAELVKAMSDPRYEDDPAYRSDLIEKLGRSNVNF